jgi:hypothetical protein
MVARGVVWAAIGGQGLPFLRVLSKGYRAAGAGAMPRTQRELNMPFVTLDEVRSAFHRSNQRLVVKKSADRILRESVDAFAGGKSYDIFLSHCFKDAETIAGVKAWLEEQGQTVYVDWIDDAQVDRSNVTAATAALLRERLRASMSLLFATSEASPSSKWMPWELGYFDGFRPGRVAVLPIVERAGGTFVGQEYLGLYPIIAKLSELQGKVVVQKAIGTRQFMDLSEFSRGTGQYRYF